MPTINDAFDELQNINSNLAQVKAAIEAGNARLDALRAQQTYTNGALFHLTQQADTIICVLEHISRNTCAALNEEHRQTGLLQGIRLDAADLLDIARSAFPGGAVALDKEKELRREIE